MRFQSFDAYDVEPQAQPDLFAERPLVLMGEWRAEKSGKVEVLGRTTKGTYAKECRRDSDARARAQASA